MAVCCAPARSEKGGLKGTPITNMGRRRVRKAAPPSDGAVGSAPGIQSSSSSSAGLAYTSSNGQPSAAGGGAAATAAAAASAGKEDDKNPLMGLLHYGSDSDDDEAPAGSHSTTKSTNISSALAYSGDAPSSADPAPAGDVTVTYVLPTGWQQCMDNAGLVYFWNTESGETAWDPPEGTETRRIPATPAAAPAAAAAAPDAAAEGSTPPVAFDASNDGSAAVGEEQAGSDGTSDTASEAEEDRVDNTTATAVVVAEAGVSADTGGESGSTAPATSTDEHKASRQSRRPAAGDNLRKDDRATAKKNAEEGKAPPQQGGTGSAAGVDDLLAGIEAELLSGDGGGDGSGAADSRSETGAEGGEEEVDFSPLRLVEPGLDKRAREAHAELTALLSSAAAVMTAVGKKEGGAGPTSAGGGDSAGRLGIELAAVLRSRLADWREGAGGEVVRRGARTIGFLYTCSTRSRVVNVHGTTATIGGYTPPIPCFAGVACALFRRVEVQTHRCSCTCDLQDITCWVSRLS